MKQYIVDAFTDKIFSGNPAAICVMNEWLSEELMMAITVENNLSETAFVVKEGNLYHLRWFTPGGEIDLCGHATLASGFVIMNYYEPALKEVKFKTLSGILSVKRNDDLYEMDFPAYDLKQVEVTAAMIEAIGKKPREAWMGRDLLCIFENEEDIRTIKPDLNKVTTLDGLLLHVTAYYGKDGYTCISRSFASKLNVSEDPVCGSGHCHIIPYWAQTMGINTIKAYQASNRGGTLYCQMDGDRVKMSGQAALYSISKLQL